MFAPYCSQCTARVLLGAESIVACTSSAATSATSTASSAATSAARHDIVLRCRCGQLVAWDAVPPRPDHAPVAAVAPLRPRRPRPAVPRVASRWDVAYRCDTSVAVPRITA